MKQYFAGPWNGLQSQISSQLAESSLKFAKLQLPSMLSDVHGFCRHLLGSIDPAYRSRPSLGFQPLKQCSVEGVAGTTRMTMKAGVDQDHRIAVCSGDGAGRFRTASGIGFGFSRTPAPPTTTALRTAIPKDESLEHCMIDVRSQAS